jgi:hypothetical protein
MGDMLARFSDTTGSVKTAVSVKTEGTSFKVVVGV